MPSWITTRGKGKGPEPELGDDAALRAAIQAAIDEANKAVPQAKAIKKP